VAAFKKLVEMVRSKQDVVEAYNRVFNSVDGQIVLMHIIKNSYVLTSTFVRGDPHETALNEGQRRLALSIMRYANMDANKLSEIAKELQNEAT
jgi:hypothetical protein